TRQKKDLTISEEEYGSRQWFHDCMADHRNSAGDADDPGRRIFLRGPGTEKELYFHDLPFLHCLCPGQHPVGAARVLACVRKRCERHPWKSPVRGTERREHDNRECRIPAASLHDLPADICCRYGGDCYIRTCRAGKTEFVHPLLPALDNARV